jgi:hypothetical protein
MKTLILGGSGVDPSSPATGHGQATEFGSSSLPVAQPARKGRAKNGPPDVLQPALNCTGIGSLA